MSHRWYGYALEQKEYPPTLKHQRANFLQFQHTCSNFSLEKRSLFVDHKFPLQNFGPKVVLLFFQMLKIVFHFATNTTNTFFLPAEWNSHDGPFETCGVYFVVVVGMPTPSHNSSSSCDMCLLRQASISKGEERERRWAPKWGVYGGWDLRVVSFLSQHLI